MSEPPTLYFVGHDFKTFGQLCQIAGDLGAGHSFSSTADRFFAALELRRPGCVVVDTETLDSEADALMARLKVAGGFQPAIVLASEVDSSVERAVHAMRTGAVDFIVKPHDCARFRASVSSAFQQSAALCNLARLREETAARYETLTAREREVLDMVVAGKPTKNIAHELGTSHNTVQNQRASILKKLDARSVVDIVRLTMLLQLDEFLHRPNEELGGAGLYQALSAGSRGEESCDGTARRDAA